MPATRKTVVLDDFDGKELPEDSKPLPLTLGRTTYSLYLSEKNEKALRKALEPFIKDADTSAPGSARRAPRAISNASGRSKDELAKIRMWAKANGHEVAERGRIRAEVVEAYEAAN